VLWCCVQSNGGIATREFQVAQSKLEAEEREIDRLESKMTAGSNLLSDKELCLQQLEMSMLAENDVCISLFICGMCVYHSTQSYLK